VIILIASNNVKDSAQKLLLKIFISFRRDALDGIQGLLIAVASGVVVIKVTEGSERLELGWV
jgi:hypothetical protein